MTVEGVDITKQDHVEVLKEEFRCMQGLDCVAGPEGTRILMSKVCLRWEHRCAREERLMSAVSKVEFYAAIRRDARYRDGAPGPSTPAPCRLPAG